jgi:hypothetical protein
MRKNVIVETALDVLYSVIAGAVVGALAACLYFC